MLCAQNARKKFILLVSFRVRDVCQHRGGAPETDSSLLDEPRAPTLENTKLKICTGEMKLEQNSFSDLAWKTEGFFEVFKRRFSAPMQLSAWLLQWCIYSTQYEDSLAPATNNNNSQGRQL